MFFQESRSFAALNSQLFDFIHTSSAALWNLRWQVQGYVSVSPQATKQDLSDRFTSGSGISANNLRGTCIDVAWEDQMGQFAQMVATNLIAMYESWAESLMLKFGAKRLIKQVQFPSKGTYGCTQGGVRDALAAARATTSLDMQRAFYPVYAAQRKYSLHQLDALLALYRYHKEVRNAVMHGGGKANPITEQAWRHAATLTAVDIGSRTSPLTSKVTDGQTVISDLREAIQLSDVLLRVVRTIDAELCVTGVAEHEFVTGWRANQSARQLRDLPVDAARRVRRLESLTRKAGYMTPADTAAIEQIGARASLL
ncbi:hypothetical protein [Streptomyces griseus]|uniref:hypothetical protein n=1 Tax=Streptomyces griseus TaxID=1911 RepID=UPI00365A92EB